MERKAVATTSAQNQGGHNGDGDDERKRKEADEAYRRLQIRKAEKAIAELLHNLTKDDHFPSFPLPERVVERHKKVKPETRRAFVNGLCVDLSTSKRNSSHFLQFIDEMLKSLSEGRRTMILSVLSSLWFDGLDFSAMIFPVVHIGAIAVSFLFVVMMFHIQIAEIHEEVLRYLPVSAIIGLIFWWEMFFILDNESIPLLPTQRKTTSLRYTVYAGKEDYNEEDDRPPSRSTKGQKEVKRTSSLLKGKGLVPIVTVAVFPSVVRAKVRFSVPASKINSSERVAFPVAVYVSIVVFLLDTNPNSFLAPLGIALSARKKLFLSSFNATLQWLPSLQSGEMRSLNHFLFDLVVKLLQLELENLKNGPEKKETPSNGTGLDRHRSNSASRILRALKAIAQYKGFIRRPTSPRIGIGKG
uniref:Uncharacterized protein n=1 Tax=Salix viminalis TaxID=40686 RepID=A0A6N2KE94_SALVM